MEQLSEKKFPVNAKDYKLYEEVGDGVSATVYRALCIPLNEVVAIKVLDLEKCNNDLDGIRREVQTMILIDHPNVLRAHCSFTAGHSLWVVMPFMAGGSCLHIMKSSYPDGFEEPVIATLLREVLKALVYLHYHGHIHRDVKAGNILIDSNGAIKLADFGVAACMFDTGDRQRSRNTFVGTPCWMAPEVMQQLHGYDFKADIWSFGITALELAHGHAPFSKYPPMKVLLMTLQNAPPGLDYERDKRFSKSFKEMVAACLVKDPKKRPSSEKLLKHPFFKQARGNDYLARTILDGLPPLGDRFRMLKAKEADYLLQNKAMYEDKDHLSQQEYIRGISAWNFNLEDLKNQAALLPDYDDIPDAEDSSTRGKLREGNGDVGSVAERPNQSSVITHEDELNEDHDLDGSLAAFPIKPLQALKGCFDMCEDDITASSPSWEDAMRSESNQQNHMVSLTKVEDQDSGKDDGENLRQSSSLPRSVIPENKKFFSGSLLQDNALSPKKVVTNGEREYQHPKYQSERNYSGPLQYRHKKDLGEDSSEGAVVQRKGRFQVTSADLSPKEPTSSFFNPVHGGSTSPSNLSLTTASLLPSLQCILQQNTLQREEILKLIKFAERGSVNPTDMAEAGTSDLPQTPAASAREKELQSVVIQLQQSIGSLVEELQRQKMKNVQLEKKLNR
ncbi:serine/threonine-protein kinase BLUS1 [Lycium ferocissimum]|uniref:serine/threonine-protein kinase BLUS1 n=1 Tax=Lycium ferocissimum TaxID=112874 RepID=UPI002814C01C|nr:serine/threonine-protein kinase BLUS1 [Lycium ferocissimum]XP_059294137.1 serine/threonine-protein kinase BLUS1 [Lycium ferocissimum]XP_059294138.1 serine/threonine-protein kinase BLUS1 [Lycium ferocissimum]XP_059294139.1 serine/threonine-protein kinase BLUS1 [Lycium ferocissimum]XP_059294140.1 serine/threonine-protein kinase BLUS1 [Lycium ferocissimum]